MVEQKIMKTPDEFLKIADEYELGIFAAKSFAEVTKGDLDEGFYSDEKRRELFG